MGFKGFLVILGKWMGIGRRVKRRIRNRKWGYEVRFFSGDFRDLRVGVGGRWFGGVVLFGVW